MNNGRTPKPTQLKKLQGTVRPDRVLKNEISPAVVSLPAPPPWLPKLAVEEWFVLTAEMESLKILTKMDMSMLAVYCQQIAVIRIATERLTSEDFELISETPNGALQPNPLLGIINKATDVALKIAGQFGFTPAARTRIGTGHKREGEGEDEFEKFMNNTTIKPMPPSGLGSQLGA